MSPGAPRRPSSVPPSGTDGGCAWKISADVDAATGAARAFRFARQLGFAPTAAAAFAVAVSELIANAVRHAGRGGVTLRALGAPRPGIEVVVEDRGPGIADLGAAMSDGWSAGRRLAPDVPHDPRCGRGVGLGAVQRLADELEIRNRPGGGLRAVARKRLPRARLSSPAGRG